MIVTLGSILAIIFNLITYFVFGSLITGLFKKRRFSATLSVIAGFFLYFALFDLFCIPLMLLFRPLSLLSRLWAGAMVFIYIISAVINWKRWRVLFGETLDFIKDHPGFCVFAGLLLIAEAVVIIYCYQFTLDAAFYVGTANTSLATDSINIYNPYTGMWQDHFEMRYFFANYAINDAVMCYLSGMHPLVWTKTVMEGVVIILVNLVMYRMGRELFSDDLKKTGVFLFFTVVSSFFYSTIFTTADFFVTRTYEGKTVIGSLVIPMIFLVYIKLLKDHKDSFYWVLLLIMSVGSLVLSNSASMLFPAALGIMMLSLLFIKRDVFILLRSAVVVLPCIASLLSYILYVKGYFVLYTMPR